jgi:aryl-alcohol dehydrogenase-like predicted oxidoreductase
MLYRQLGNTGLQISEVGLGGNVFGSFVDADQAYEIINRALDLGMNHIDTADIYARTTSEQLVGKAIAHRRQDVILATKVGMPRGAGPNMNGLSYRRIIASCEESLKRIGTDYIDLYYLHQPDPLTPIEETFRVSGSGWCR